MWMSFLMQINVALLWQVYGHGCLLRLQHNGILGEARGASVVGVYP